MAEKKRRDIIFRRIRGRIVPIRRKKEDVSGAVKIGGSLAIGATSAGFATRELKASNKLFNKAALLRGARRLSKPGSKASRKIGKEAIRISRLAASKLGRSKFLVFGGALGSSLLASSAVGDLLAGRTKEETKEAFQTIASLGTGLATVAFFGKRAKLRGFRSSLRQSIKSGSPDEQIGVVFGKFETSGRSRTQKLIEKIAGTRIKKSKQLDIFKFLKKF